MPYIAQDDRKALDSGSRQPATAGELNYMISTTVLASIKIGSRQTVLFDCLLLIGKEYIGRAGLNYAHINDVLGAYSGAALELRRRTRYCGVESRLISDVSDRFYSDVAAPYEDTKIAANGDLPYP